MGKSRNRKDHKKKVKQRNERIKNEFKRAQKSAWEKFEQRKQEEKKDDFIYPDFK